VIAGMLAIVYFINCFTPLRLTNDTLRYFAIMERMDGTWPAEFGAYNDFLPMGYVYFLMALAKLHILHSFTICLLQLLFLAGSLNYVRKLFGPSVPVWTLIIFSLLNWTTIKLTITPLSEMQFLFFTTGTLYYFQKLKESKKFGFLVATILFCTLAIWTRTAGVVLLIALLATLLINNWRRFSRNKIPLIIAGVIVVAGFILLFTQPKFTRYLGYFFKPLADDPASFFYKNITRHFRDWAELFINIPFSKVNVEVVPILIYLPVGILTMSYVVRRLLMKKFPIPFHVRIYFIGYILLIFNWPFYEARFWFPVLPLAFAVMLLPKQAPNFTVKYWKVFLKAYYAIIGFLVLGYYTALSYSKTGIAEKHDAGLWKKEYRIHFFNEKPAHSVYNKKALYILDKYD
jgi:hypothetical protein